MFKQSGESFAGLGGSIVENIYIHNVDLLCALWTGPENGVSVTHLQIIYITP